MIGDPTSRTYCWRCLHPYAWHLPADPPDADRSTYTRPQFRCLGHDPADASSVAGCDTQCPQSDPGDTPDPDEATAVAELLRLRGLRDELLAARRRPNTDEVPS